MATLHKPTVHVEVQLKDHERNFIPREQIAKEVTQWLRENFVYVRINQEIVEYEGLSTLIESVRIVDFDGDTPSTEGACIRLEDGNLSVHTFQLFEENTATAPTSLAEHDGDSPVPHMRVISLPNKELVGFWEALVFEDSAPKELFRYTARMVVMARKGFDLVLQNWNRLALIHGPPGTGKTTLIRGIAQRLAIRLSGHFTSSRLIEINAQVLTSKWFGETGKLVEQIFDQIFMVAANEETLVCVLIDEVETLAGSRDRMIAGNECSDGLRAVNQLLTGLDKIRFQANIVVFCTSNLLGALDAAFQSRVDEMLLVPNPSPRAAYEILRSCLNSLIECEILKPAPLHDSEHGSDGSYVDVQPETLNARTPPGSYFPSVSEATLLCHSMPDSLGYKLWQISQRCAGLSGRTLRRLPLKSVAKYTYSDDCTVDDALAALLKAVTIEIRSDIASGLTSSVVDLHMGD